MLGRENSLGTDEKGEGKKGKSPGCLLGISFGHRGESDATAKIWNPRGSEGSKVLLRLPMRSPACS